MLVPDPCSFDVIIDLLLKVSSIVSIPHLKGKYVLIHRPQDGFDTSDKLKVERERVEALSEVLEDGGAKDSRHIFSLVLLKELDRRGFTLHDEQFELLGNGDLLLPIFNVAFDDANRLSFLLWLHAFLLLLRGAHEERKLLEHSLLFRGLLLFLFLCLALYFFIVGGVNL